ncbi:tetratricopeptide repeat protein [Ferrovibrio sp.]|uniref:tetratricopeptide repeat protein n=1 Tax=Ferrovibrio sp. TaxID=1917215 RepID=UPI0025BC45C3|nr:tetratricopeptide repeat protein [Ferrovibrio sp.]MBX3456099.1 tetratricopeptide repeat protein [Ferrovibrio sp.]
MPNGVFSSGYSVRKFSLLLAALLPLLAGCNAGMQQAARPASTAGQTAQRAADPILEKQLSAYDEATQLSSRPAVKAENQFRKGVALIGARRSADAIAVFEAMIAAWGDEADVAVQRFVMAGQLNAGAQYRMLKQYDKALATYEAAARRGADASDDGLRRNRAAAKADIGEVQIDRQQYAEATVSLRRMLAEECGAPEPIAGQTCLRARRQLAWALHKRGLNDDALATLNEAIQRPGNASATPQIREEMTRIHARKAMLLADVFKRPAEAVDAYGEAVKVGMQANTPTARYWSAVSLFNRGVALNGLGRRQEALESYDRVLLYFDSYNDQALILPLGYALLNKAYVLQALGRPAEALPVYEAAQRKAAQFRPDPRRDLIGLAQLGSGRVLTRLQRYDEAIARFDDAITTFKAAAKGELNELAAQAANAKATTLDLQRNRQSVLDQMASFDKALAAAREKPEPARSQGVGATLLLQATTYMVLGMHGEAITIFDRLDADYGGSTDTVLRGIAARALQGKALAQQGQGSNADAAQTMRRLIERHKDVQAGPASMAVREAEKWLQNNPQHDPVG